MASDTGLYTIDDVWELQRQAPSHIKHVELIHGRPVEIQPAFLLQGVLAAKLSSMIGTIAEDQDLGTAGIRVGCYLEKDRHTLLAPFIAFVSKAKMPVPPPEGFLNFMPDLAVEIAASNNPVSYLRNKARILLRYGTQMVWIVLPEQRQAEVRRLEKDGQIMSQIVEIDGKLSGEDVLPGFELELRQLFPK